MQTTHIPTLEPAAPEEVKTALQKMVEGDPDHYYTVCQRESRQVPQFRGNYFELLDMGFEEFSKDLALTRDNECVILRIPMDKWKEHRRQVEYEALQRSRIGLDSKLDRVETFQGQNIPGLIQTQKELEPIAAMPTMDTVDDVKGSGDIETHVPGMVKK